jgi:hypothetical protein
VLAPHITPHITPHIASTPLSAVGSISNVHTSGSTVAATFALATSGCNVEPCRTLPEAFFVHPPENCAYGSGKHKWIFYGSRWRPVPDLETGTATFMRAPGPITICLYMDVHTKSYTESSQPPTLLAETNVDAAGNSRAGVPLTVTNICSLNPGLGDRYPFNGPNGPGVYWDNNKNGIVEFAAFSYEGDNAVDAVFVNDRYGVLTWFAHCYPHQTSWINYPTYVSEHSQPAPQPQAPVSSQQLQLAPQPLQDPFFLYDLKDQLAKTSYPLAVDSVGTTIGNDGQCKPEQPYCISDGKGGYY